MGSIAGTRTNSFTAWGEIGHHRFAGVVSEDGVRRVVTCGEFFSSPRAFRPWPLTSLVFTWLSFCDLRLLAFQGMRYQRHRTTERPKRTLAKPRAIVL